MTSPVAVVRRRLAGTYDVDEWGLDPDFVTLLSPAFALRWAIDVEGAEHLPDSGPAVLVCNRRVGLSEPFVLSRGIRLATGRFVRPLGAPDVAGIGPLFRRFGAALDRPDEMAGLLRHGEVVVVSLDRELRHRHRAGRLHPEALVPCRDVPVIPAAVVGRELGRRWRVVLGPAVPAPARRGGALGPLEAAELVEQARAGVQDLLDEAFPPRWPFG